jgi:mutator protein MutT
MFLEQLTCVGSNMINVAAGIIEKDGKVFAARRKPGNHHLAGFWEFPGGKLEPGESPQACLQRELAEELGIQVAVGAFFGENIHEYGDKRVLLLAYRVTHLSGEFQLLDHDKLCWVAPDEMLDFQWAPADIPLVEQYRAEALTWRYYRERAASYADETLAMDMSALYQPFFTHLSSGAHILDLGCGSGRDSSAFLDSGYRVTAVDGSAELAALAEAVLGQSVRVAHFQELADVERYDGVWACASLLHCPRAQLPDVLERLVRALKPGGVGYLSFKWGEDEVVDERGRYFNNHTAQTLKALLRGITGIETPLLWESTTPSKTDDGRSGQRWINAILRKRCIAG